MSRFVVARAARKDLREIYQHIAERNPGAAGRLRETFLGTFAALAQNPLMGEARNDIAPGVRTFVSSSYLILYQPIRSGIRVVQVVHAARDVEVILRRFRDGE